MLHAGVAFREERMLRKDFLAGEGVKVAAQEADDILAILVPKFVLDKIRAMELAIAEQ